MIRIENLSKNYGESVIFENTSISFPDKGLICILGPSGCGKSTLLNLIAGFDSAYEGEISVHGTLLSKMNAEELCAYRRDHVGFVFQNYHLLSGYTALENIMLAPGATEESAKELLEKIGLSEKAGQKVETLSGGEKQRVAIARALVNGPTVILSDEPTGALDRKNSAEIMELLKTLAENRLVIVITHDKKCAEYAEQIVTIQDGKLVCENRVSGRDESAALDAKNIEIRSLWKRAFKNFKVHLSRYIAIALAISIGVVCFMMSLSSGNMMEQSIVDFEKKNTAYHNGYIKADGNGEELRSLLEEDKRIENVYEQYVLQNVSVELVGQNRVVLEEKYPMAKAAEQMSYGVMPRRGKNEIALNPSLAKKFAENIQNLIGQTVELAYAGQTYQVTVSGIFNATFDDYYVSSDLEQQMYEGQSGEVYSVSYDVKEFEDIPAVSEGLKQQNLNSQNAGAEVEVFLKTFENLKRLFLIVSVLIFAIGIFISAILLVKQQNTRFREVGLLSALGYTGGNIRKLLLYENLCLSAISALGSGIFIALAVTVGQAADFPLAFTVVQIFVTFCLTAIVILMLGMGASTRLIRTEPAKALRM